MPHATKFRKSPAFSSPLGNVFSVLLKRKEAGHGNDTLVAFYYPDIIQNNDYYPFGAPMERRSQQNRKYRYGFNGKEKDQEGMGGGSSTYDYGFRIYNPALGKFLSVDPKAHLMPAWSPYSMGFNNPIIFVDPDGQYPIYFITRSYAPFKSFGPEFARYKGDNRGHTLDRGASYRTMVSIMHDTELRTTEAYGGHSTSRTIDGSKSAVSPTHVDNRTKEGSDFINVHSYGNNEAEAFSWDIDQFTKLTVGIEGDVEKDHVLSITGTISGDDFPNQEAMIYDTKGNTLWLGNFETSVGPVKGPLWNLARENEDAVHINVDVRIKVNADGVFQGVMQGDKMISIDDWNKQFE